MVNWQGYFFQVKNKSQSEIFTQKLTHCDCEYIAVCVFCVHSYVCVVPFERENTKKLDKFVIKISAEL